jgi:hypothetical protein
MSKVVARETKKVSVFEPPIEEYPFKYDDNFVSEDFEQFVAHKELQQQATTPKIGAKIDEVFDSYLEDSLFRIIYPNPLQNSPLALKFNLNNRKRAILPIGSLSMALFGSSGSSARTSFISWQKILQHESLIDSSIHTPADYITDPEQTHLANRRSVYEACQRFQQLSMIKSGFLRSAWRFFSRFTIYFVKGLFAGFGMYTTDRFLIPTILKFK